MTHHRRTAVALLVLVLAAAVAHAEPLRCQKQVVKALLKFKKSYLKAHTKCLDRRNAGKQTGPCLDPVAEIKLDRVKAKVATKIEVSCPDPDLTTLGFPPTCAYETTPTGIENACAGLPVATPGEFAACLMCWKGAELREFVATLYASHAEELCEGAFDETSPRCSELDCASPLPTQRDLGDTAENDCQRAIGKAGTKHLVSIEKELEKCGLKGNDRVTCLADPIVQLKLDKSELKLDGVIKKKCGNNRNPIPDPPFCCRTGMGNACMAATSRDDCTMNLGGTVQENKTCSIDNKCDPVGGGGQKITWWSTCPQHDTCDGTLDTLQELIDCVDETAHESAAELLCVQFAAGWGPCPGDAGSPSGAFVD